MSSNRRNILKEFEHWRISAIIRTDDKQIAKDAMLAAIGGGFRIIEFTLTTPGALQLISQFSAEEKDLIVGAGTVLTPKQAEEAVNAGAQFLVSPICDAKVISKAIELDVVSIPGTFTATEMENAHRLGADMVKLFPAPADVAQYVSAILGPLPYLKIFPTNGVDIDNMLDVLRAGAVGVGYVKSLFNPSDLKEKNFSAIEKRAATICQKLSELY